MRGITLFALFNLALKHIVALILSAVIFAVGAYAYCEYVAVPRYSVTGSLLITNGAVDKNVDIDENGEVTKLQNADIIASINFMETATDMLKQNGIYKMLAQKFDNQYSYGQLMDMATVERRNEKSLYMDVTFNAASPEVAKKLVNEFMAIAPGYFKTQVPSVAVSYFEVDSASKVSPKTSTTVGLFAIVGAALAYAIFLILFLLNTTIVNETDLKERFDVPVIGSIPDFATARSKKYSKYYNRKYGYYNYYGNYGRSD